MSDKPTLPERVQASYRQLSIAATGLNSASDELGETISQLNAALEPLNLGVAAWVQITGDADEWDNYWSRDIGYAKVGNEWGIALRTRSGNAQDSEPDREESWPFNGAPRWLRVEGIGKIPELLEKLIKQAEETTKRIKQKTAEAKELAAAIKAAAAESTPAKRK